ncbi:MAG: chitobiase/beta-hexosaminidase C-terminal domain-containing protein, partial [Clostridia bacterium]|nr:chitobiase/beta-hexosaminidase C-terminal domain-containing protein [Clostridia bacterium]
MKKITSIILCIIMLTSCFLSTGVLAYTDAEKAERSVYLHAQGEKPTSTPSSSTVYLGDIADIYFAVDDPNKGDYLDIDDEAVKEAEKTATKTATEKADSETNWSQEKKDNYIKAEVAKAVERARHSESKYDMNGYRLRICFDPAYFEFAPGTDLGSPIDYKVPEANFSDAETDQGTVGGKPVGTVPTSIGYFWYDGGNGTYSFAGKKYTTAFITVFYGGDFVPQKKDDQLWYNLAKLSLKPIKEGSTDVFVDIDSGEERFALELFAKNEDSDELPDQSFDFSAMHGGFHTIVIKDKSRPTPPVAEPTTGNYVEKVEVTLKQNEGLKIYYTKDGSDPSKPESTREEYKEPLTIDINTVIRACAYRESDKKYSSVVSYEYTIIPDRPYLFFDDKTTLVPDIYPTSNKFTVYVSDKNTFGSIADENEIYYTFSNANVENPVIGDDPEKGWVKLSKQTQDILIDQKRTVRLFTSKQGLKSDVAWYYFSIKPEPALASHESDTYSGKIDVTLKSDTDGAIIYYTTDGSDPKTSSTARTYDEGIPITLSKDTTLKTVAYYDGEWSDKKSYNYLFSYYDDYGVDAFYPSGVYEGSVNVTLTPNNPDYEVWYHTGDGNWKPYEKVIILDKDTDITAKAVEVNPDGTVKSEGNELYYFTYKIKPLPPEFAPESTQFTNADRITIYTPESNQDNTGRYTLFYTLDGSDPITSDTRIKADEASDSAIVEITEYTEVSAVVLKDGSTSASYSTVVTHSYDIVTLKPVKPLTTLLPGYYTHEVGGEGYTTQFMPVPKGTQIYYTISYDGGLCPDPIPNTSGTLLYDGISEIELKGNTVIKAVAVNSFGVKSDIGIFSYTITPEAPIAAPSASLSEFPLVPVDAVKGSKVEYTIGNVTNSFDNTGGERFYIDTETGNAYRNEDRTGLLGDESTEVNTSPVKLAITSTLDGVTSDLTECTYIVSSQNRIPAPPYADKDTGMYEERRIDDSNNFLDVSLYSLNS